MQGPEGRAPVLSVACGLWKLKQVKYHRVPGGFSRDDVGTGRGCQQTFAECEQISFFGFMT